MKIIDTNTFEKLKIRSVNVNDLKNIYNYFPSTTEELKELIINRINNKGYDVDLNDIDVSKIKNMKRLFCIYDDYRFIKFCGKMSRWDVSNVVNMDQMFYGCHEFNDDLSGWNVSSVTTMSGMFYDCYKFNRNLNDWDVSHVVDFSSMFSGCHIFNSPLDKWNIKSAKTIDHMFEVCEEFNQNISDWDISNVDDLCGTFYNAKNFYCDLSGWDLENKIYKNLFFGTLMTKYPNYLPKNYENL